MMCVGIQTFIDSGLCRNLGFVSLLKVFSVALFEEIYEGS